LGEASHKAVHNLVHQLVGGITPVKNTQYRVLRLGQRLQMRRSWLVSSHHHWTVTFSRVCATASGASMRPVRPARTLGSVPKHARTSDRPDRESKRPGRLAWPLLAKTRHVGARHQVAEIAALQLRRVARFTFWPRWIWPAGGCRPAATARTPATRVSVGPATLKRTRAASGRDRRPVARPLTRVRSLQ
jgi:hypothetical protein